MQKFLLFALLILGCKLFGQVYPGARPVTCQQEEITLRDLFARIYTQTGMIAFYNDEQLSSYEILSVNFHNEPLDNVLATLLRKRGMAWCYRKEVFVVAFKMPGEPDLGFLKEDMRTIKGTVIDEKEQPLEGATIMTVDGNKGTITNREGRFLLHDIQRDANLDVRRIGYKSRILSSYADSVFVQLIPTEAPLPEISVTGKVQNILPGSSSSLTAKEVSELPINNVLGALQGRIPGLYINQTTGLPGGGYRLRLRGKNSIESVSDPLILVDDIPFPSVPFNETYATNIGQSQSPIGTNITPSPLNLLTINDIEKVEILKDADATALYGSQGVNGIIRIISKKAGIGKKGLAANFYSGIGTAENLLRYMDTRQYVAMRREGIRNTDGNRPLEKSSDYDIADWDTARYTDWQKEMIGSTAHISEGNIEYQNGSVDAAYRVSAMFRQESTVYPSEHFKYKKGGVMMQGYWKPHNQKLSIDFLGIYVADHNLIPTTDLTTFSSLPPTTPESHTAEDKINFWNGDFINPYASLLRTTRHKSKNIRGGMNFTYTPTKELIFKVKSGINLINVREVQVNPAASYNSSGTGFNDTYFFENRFQNSIIEVQAAWRKKLGKQDLSVIGGIRTRFDNQVKKNYYGFLFPNDGSLEDSAAATEIMWLDSARNRYQYTSYYGRIEYKYANRYVLTATVNKDRSERIAYPNRYGNFGSVAAAWIFNREPWLANVGWLDLGKIRASYGIAGNDQYSRNLKRQTFILDTVLLNKGIVSANSVQNPIYNWERVRRAEVGIDLGMLNNRISTIFSYYFNKSNNQLLTGAFPLQNGQDTFFMPVNMNATVANRGFEVDLEATVIRSRTFSWITSLNLSFPKNKLLSFPYLELSRYNLYYSKGKSLDMVKGYQFIGVDQNSGVYQFVDINNNGLSLEDRVGREIGPFFYGGWYNNFHYRGFELSFLFRFAKQNNYNYQFAVPYVPGSPGNQPLLAHSRWQRPGDKTGVQQYSSSVNNTTGDAYWRARESDQQLTDASYVRMQSITFSYCLSQKILNSLKIRNCKFYVQALNLFTITKYNGRDPEIIVDAEAYPSLRVITAGITLNPF